MVGDKQSPSLFPDGRDALRVQGGHFIKDTREGERDDAQHLHPERVAGNDRGDHENPREHGELIRRGKAESIRQEPL